MSEELKAEIRAKIYQYLASHRLETNKLEFKRQWYNLKDVKDRNEFLKDATAIVNSYGGDDGFIVIGIDEKDKSLWDSKIDDSGYKDQASIRNIIDANVDKPFRFDIDYLTIEEKTLCIVHLLPSTDKPHVILRYSDKNGKEHENEIFLRSGSSKVVASKADLDRMYIERNSIIVERKADVAINFHAFKSSYSSETSMHTIVRPILIENRGTRVLPIYKIFLQFNLDGKDLSFVHETTSDKPIIIEPNSIFRDSLKFAHYVNSYDPQTSHQLNELVNQILENPRHGDVVCSFILATGEYLPANLYMPNINHAKNSQTIADMMRYSATF
jgi:hypothetical protein